MAAFYAASVAHLLEETSPQTGESGADGTQTTRSAAT